MRHGAAAEEATPVWRPNDGHSFHILFQYLHKISPFVIRTNIALHDPKHSLGGDVINQRLSRKASDLLRVNSFPSSPGRANKRRSGKAEGSYQVHYPL